MNSASPTQCTDIEVMLHGFVDGELDAVHSLQIERHTASCSLCLKKMKDLQALKQLIGQKGVQWQTPHDMRVRVLESVSQEAAMQTRSGVLVRKRGTQRFDIFAFARQWMFVPSLAALAASLLLVIAPISDRSTIGDEVLSSHIRSLLVDHLTDVATSDQHTVKPWFSGKIDFSPPVVDLAREGFPLQGGRVDYIGGRVVAALVYKRHAHVINVFVWPTAVGGAPAMSGATASRDGYSMESWSVGVLTFCAVSDLNAADLARFKEAFSSKTAS